MASPAEMALRTASSQAAMRAMVSNIEHAQGHVVGHAHGRRRQRAPAHAARRGRAPARPVSRPLSNVGLARLDGGDIAHGVLHEAASPGGQVGTTVGVPSCRRS